MGFGRKELRSSSSVSTSVSSVASFTSCHCDVKKKKEPKKVSKREWKESKSKERQKKKVEDTNSTCSAEKVRSIPCPFYSMVKKKKNKSCERHTCPLMIIPKPTEVNDENHQMTNDANVKPKKRGLWKNCCKKKTKTPEDPYEPATVTEVDRKKEDKKGKKETKKKSDKKKKSEKLPQPVESDICEKNLAVVKKESKALSASNVTSICNCSDKKILILIS